jgi:hypothetical protein
MAESAQIIGQNPHFHKPENPNPDKPGLICPTQAGANSCFKIKIGQDIQNIKDV